MLNVLLKRSRDSGFPSPHFNRTVSYFSSFKMRLAMGVSWLALFMLRYVPSGPTSSYDFYHEGM